MGAPSKLPPTRPPFARNSVMILSFQLFASGIPASSCLVRSARQFCPTGASWTVRSTDQLNGAVDAEVARRSRLGRDGVVGDEGGLGVPGLHNEPADLAFWRGVSRRTGPLFPSSPVTSTLATEIVTSTSSDTRLARQAA